MSYNEDMGLFRKKVNGTLDACCIRKAFKKFLLNEEKKQGEEFPL
jgi:hypothetical protein